MSPALQQVANAIRDGKKIEAIRLMRDATGMSLAESTAAVEKLIAEGDASSTTSLSSSSLTPTTSASSLTPTSSTSSPTPASNEYDFNAALKADLDAIRSPRAASTLPLAQSLADEVAVLATQRKYLDAIKLVRARTGVNLKVAKDQVEMVMEARGLAEPGKSGCIVAVVVAVVVAFIGLTIIGFVFFAAT